VPSDDKVIFQQVIESLERVLGPALDERLRARYRDELGVDFKKPLPAYPLETWNKAVRLAMGALRPGAPEAEAQKFLGRRVVETFQQTLVGAALFAALRVLGARRAVVRMTKNLRTSNNYTESTIAEVGEGVYSVWLNQIELPWFDQGVLEAGLRGAGAPACVVEVVEHDAKGTTYRVNLNL
jgi:uncharacterized protein (TIGR02265 family)